MAKILKPQKSRKGNGEATRVSKVKYTIADLVWEATRRNQDYKNDYASTLEKCRNGKNRNIKLLSVPPSNWSYKNILTKWSIRIIVKADDLGLPKVLCWVDPSIDIDKIKKDISSGIPDYHVHPYHHINDSERMKPDIYYHRISQEHTISPFIERTINYTNVVCINKNLIGNNFLLLISPTSSDESIMEAVQEAKQRVLKGIKEENDSFKKNGVDTYNPLKIEKYIGWLKKYDKIVDHLGNSEHGKPLTYEKGACIVPDDFSFGDLVPKKVTREKFEGQRKAYKRAYVGAVKLIQSAPNIIFSPPKTKQA